MVERVVMNKIAVVAKNLRSIFHDLPSFWNDFHTAGEPLKFFICPAIAWALLSFPVKH